MINSDDDAESPDARLMTPSTTRDDSLLYTSSGGSGDRQHNDQGIGLHVGCRGGPPITARSGNRPDGHVQTLQTGHYAVPSALRYNSNNNRNSNTTPRGIRSAKDLLLVNRENRGSSGSNGGRRIGAIESLPLAFPSPIPSPATPRNRDEERKSPITSPNPTHSRSTNTSAIFAN